MQSSTKDVIIFLIPPEKFVSGGIISIFSLCAQTRKTLSEKAAVYISTYPGAKSYRKNDLFDNDEYVYDFDEVLKQNSSIESLIIHIPEYSLGLVTKSLNNYRDLLSDIKKLHINILNQNIKLMPDESYVASLHTFTSDVTQTTAHKKYTNQKIADKYNIPTHLFSVRIDQDQYDSVPFDDKDDLIIISPDPHPLKATLIKSIKSKTSFTVLEIDNLTYEEYKTIISKAKFTVTFGEGMDGYFIETIFSGGIGITSYNDDFFPSKDFLELENVYSSYEQLCESFTDDLQRINKSKAIYDSINTKNMEKLEKIYGRSFFEKNVADFYNQHYTYRPTSRKSDHFYLTSIRQKDVIIWDLEEQLIDIKNKSEENNLNLQAVIRQRDTTIHKLHNEISLRDNRINDLINSTSWKTTRPFRRFVQFSKKLISRMKRVLKR